MKYILPFLMGITLLGCVSTRHQIGEETLISTKGKKGCWVTNPSCADTRETKAFTGISHRYRMEADARDDALKNARKQIIDAMGVSGKRKVYEVISSAGVSSDIIDPAVVADDMTKLVSQAFIKSRAKEFYIENWKEWKENGWNGFCRAYVLVPISNSEIEAQMEESIRKKAEALKEEKDRKNIERALKLMKKMETEDW
jgi:hypothetical protein